MRKQEQGTPVRCGLLRRFLPLLLLFGTLVGCRGNDLSLPAVGPYAVDQIGPVYILDRKMGHALLFPVVVGQANGAEETRNLRFHDIWWDPRPGRHTTYRVLGLKADRGLNYWSYRVLFRETGPHDWTVPNLPGWDRAEALVECARSGSDMVIAVTFRNEDPAETVHFFADLLGGFDGYYQTLPPGDAVVRKDVAEGWMSIEHPGMRSVFVVKGRGAEAHLFDIRDSYFHPGAEADTGGTGMHDSGTYEGDGNGWWCDVNLAGIEVGPGEERTVYYAIKKGLNLDGARPGADRLLDRAPGILQRSRGIYAQKRYPVDDPLYREAMEHAVSQILINTIYNGNTTDAAFSWNRDRYFTPSRFYASFHHWDAGCISLGLMEYDVQLALENVDAALPDEWPWGSYDLHPTPPTAIFALWEIYQGTQDVSVLERYYPAARNWHLSYLDMARSDDGDWLLDWHGEGPDGEPELYGMGSGMDDLPVWEHAKTAGPGGTLRHLEPPCFQSLTIRMLKLLRMMARTIGKDTDVAEYTDRISLLQAGLQTHMWHAEKGIFVPVWQDDKSFVEGYEDTIIGVYPIFTGRDIITENQKDRLLEYMTDPATLWSGFGVRTVSASAPYYVPHFGWWGAVWIPYEWFFWKGLLALGEVDLARTLAWDVLENFRKNHQERSYLIEMCNGDTGETIGAKDFTGLGSPVISLYAAYNTPGQVSVGWDACLHGRAYDPEADSLAFTASAPDTPGPAGFVAVMGAPEQPYSIRGSGGTRAVVSDETGALSFVEDVGYQPLEIRIEPVAAGSEPG